MDFQFAGGINIMPLSNKMIPEELKPNMKSYDPPGDLQMTSSLISVTSSLTSPVDSGVQLLDSESDITSVMSMSGTTFDLNLLNDSKEELVKSDTVECLVKSASIEKDVSEEKEYTSDDVKSYEENEVGQASVMTKSDIANQNVAEDIYVADKKIEDDQKDLVEISLDINEEEKHDADKPDLSVSTENVLANEMHVSVSEEVQENLASAPLSVTSAPTLPTPADEQIVFRRQRKKKSSKSDTPKKRVSFHEDILNSSKVDDVRIEHGFITHQPDISMSFFSWDSIRRKDVVKGRYSWAGEGDTPYYQRNVPERETRSELYMGNTRQQWASSSSSSCTGSVDSSSSNSLCESDTTTTSSSKPPARSCLKKRPSTRQTIETHVVEESTGSPGHRNRRSETNLLDSNIFGSLKNILSLSSSVPLAERGVPEGQEDVSMYGSSTDLQQNKQKQRQGSFSSGSRDSWVCRSVDRNDKLPELPLRLQLDPPRSQLKLVPSDTVCQPTGCPPNVVLCDSAVYEHKGISYSYEYDKFQKSFETQQAQTQKPKSSTIYQLLLRDLNFFKKREKEISENNLESSQPTTSTPVKDQSTTSKSDWSSDTTETISDLCDNIPSKHLCSPKHKVKANHYSVQNFKPSDLADIKSDEQGLKSSQTLKANTSKTSLINRFLRNVTMKKLLDAKLLKKQKPAINKYMGLYMRGLRPNQEICRELDEQLEQEIQENIHEPIAIHKQLGSNFMLRLKKEVFRDPQEQLLTLYKVRSVYSALGETKPLIVFLTNATLYITGFKPNQSLKNIFVLPYCELNTILIGPDAHTIYFSGANSQMEWLLCTGSADLTSQLIGRLEMAMRTEGSKDASLPAVRHLTMRDMTNLRFHICKQTAIDKEEEYFHYSVVNIQEINCESSITPLGPIKEGPLMFKTSNDVRWETGYFILKGGVLYMLSSPSNRLPMRVLPLGGGACVGAHRTPYCLRPHTFELLLNGLTLQLAAPDEYVASDWLQLLVQTASGLYSSHEMNHTQCCTLLLTSCHLVTIRESFPPINDQDSQIDPHTLGCAAISDITALRIPQAEQSWCVLEFACREVHETSGDLVLYFATNTELERFLHNLAMLWSYNNIKGDSFPLSTISEDEPINKKCVDAYRTLQSSWAALGVALD